MMPSDPFRAARHFSRACSLTKKNQGQAHAHIHRRDLSGHRDERDCRLAPRRISPIARPATLEGALNMDGLFLRFYFQESQRCRDGVAWEWLLKQANKLRIRGGSAFRAMAGFGHHHKIHEMTFFEVLSPLAVEVEFIVTEHEAELLLDLVRKEGLRAFYAKIPAQFGVINPDQADPLPAAVGK
jgi:PII-like signaling protein